MIRAAAALAGVLAVAAAGAAFAEAQRDGKTVVERDKVDVAPAEGVSISRVAIDNRFGEVTVIGHDKPGMTIVAVKRAPDEATMDRLKVSLVPDPSGPVSIETSLLAAREARPVAAGSIRIDLLIYAPRAARIDATTWNGAVAIERVDNGAEITANEGDVKVKSCSGEIATHVGQGRQEFSEVFGSLDAEGVAGEMRFETVKGDRLGAVMHDGAITARTVRVREVALRTTRGDIEFEGEPIAGGSVRIASHRGNVRVSFREGASFRVQAIARRGPVVAHGVELESRAGRSYGAYGGGEDPAGVFVSTRFGRIELEVRAAGDSL